MTETATVNPAKATEHLRTAGGHMADAARSTGHAARIAAERTAEHARTGYGHVKTGLTNASDAIKGKGLSTATREGAQAFWKARPLATIGLAVGGTVLAAHVVGHAFSGPKSQQADMARGTERGGRPR